MDILNIVKLPVCRCDIPLRSGRIYPRHVLEEAIMHDPKIQEALANESLLGGFTTQYQDISIYNDGVPAKKVSHLVSRLYFEDNVLYAECLILNTPQGRKMNSSLSKRGLHLYLNGRGGVDISSNEVQTGYEFITIMAEDAKPHLSESFLEPDPGEDEMSEDFEESTSELTVDPPEEHPSLEPEQLEGEEVFEDDTVELDPVPNAEPSVNGLNGYIAGMAEQLVRAGAEAQREFDERVDEEVGNYINSLRSE